MNRSALLAMSVILVGLVALVMLFFTTLDTEFGTKKKSLADLGGDFTLQSSQGPVSLSDFEHKVVVMYFGFRTCPEVCPNSMGVVSNALNRLTDQQRESTQAILVSIDPKRDSVEQLDEYARFYHPNLVGLTGSMDDIDAVTKQYGAYYNFTEIDKATADYAVEHSSRYYVIDQAGKLVAAMRHSTTANELYAQISYLLNPIKEGV